MKKLIKILAVVLCLVVVTGSFAGCLPRKSCYSTEEHLDNIAKRIEEDYLESYHTGFDVYPVYDENDEFRYALVEFEPYGFMFVLISDNSFNLSGGKSLYSITEEPIIKQWQRYSVMSGATNVNDEKYKTFEVDERNKPIIYSRSPYLIANVSVEKYYLLNMNQGGMRFTYIPSVKRDDKYLNLISGEEFVYAAESGKWEQACFDFQFYPGTENDL